MIEFKPEELCYSERGRKIHIRFNSAWTYCSGRPGSPLKEEGLVGLTEKATELCRNCLRGYKRRKEQGNEPILRH